ncbi:hypothetical protein M0R72_09100 [Candidatus Pacearchaeota archaeon]|nr:hypothetical protein [Candidatus Pacearchaeota archaeon]
MTDGYHTNIGPFQSAEESDSYGVPIGPYTDVVIVRNIVPAIAGKGRMLVTADVVAEDIVLETEVDPTLTVLPYRPERPLTEHLIFKTEIHRTLGGQETRMPLRKCPRIAVEPKIADGRQFMESYLPALAMDEMVFPYWHEPAYLTAAASAGQSSVMVGTTAVSQFKAGYFALLSHISGKYDICRVSSVAADALEFDGLLLNDYPIGSEVLPAYKCWADRISVTKRLRYAMYDLKLEMSPVDNDLGVTPYANGELSMVDVNYIDLLRESHSRPHYRLDSGYGLMFRTVLIDRGDRGSLLGFWTHSRGELWALRQLLYRLRGRAISFDLATFAEELTPNAALVGGSTSLNVAYCGYTDFVRSRRNSIRIVLRDDTVLSRTVVDSQVISDATERLTLNAAWPETIQPESVARIEYLDRVRLDADDIVIQHQNALGWASCQIPVITVEE